MNDVTLIPVAKDGEYLEVHPTALSQHKQLGWRECEKREVAKEDEGDGTEGAKKATVAELREALTAKGVEIPEGAKKADLQALLDAQPTE